MFGRATITLGIGPHSSSFYCCSNYSDVMLKTFSLSCCPLHLEQSDTPRALVAFSADLLENNLLFCFYAS